MNPGHVHHKFVPTRWFLELSELGNVRVSVAAEIPPTVCGKSDRSTNITYVKVLRQLFNCPD